MKEAGAESTPIQSLLVMGVSNVLRRRKVGGFISVGVRSAGTSVAAIALRVSMRPGTQLKRGIRSLPASSQVRIGFTITTRAP